MKETILKYLLLLVCVESSLLSAQKTYSYSYDFKWYKKNDTT